MDALAKLADERNCNRCLRPCRSFGQRRGAQPPFPYPAAVGGHYYGTGCPTASGTAELWYAYHRRDLSAVDCHDWHLLFRRAICLAPDQTELSRNGTRVGQSALGRSG